MKFKTLLNLIKIDSKRCILLEDYDRKIKLDMIYTLLRRSRYTQKFIDNFINYECKDKEGLETGNAKFMENGGFTTINGGNTPVKIYIDHDNEIVIL